MTTLLHRAALEGRTDAIARLVRDGVAIDAKDALSKTPMHCAAGAGHVEAVALLRLGANPLAKTMRGHIPRFLAENGMRKNDWKSVVKFLEAATAAPQQAPRSPVEKRGAGEEDEDEHEDVKVEGNDSVAATISDGVVPLKEWSVEKVVAWLGSVEDGIFAPYCRSFRDYGISGDILLELSDTGLESLGISAVEHRKKLLQVILLTLRTRKSCPIMKDYRFR